MRSLWELFLDLAFACRMPGCGQRNRSKEELFAHLWEHAEATL